MSTLVGKVEGIYYTSGRENYSIPVNEIEFSFEGMQGDKHFGLTAFALTKHPEYKEKIEVRNSRQISILSVEEIYSGGYVDFETGEYLSEVPLYQALSYTAKFVHGK